MSSVSASWERKTRRIKLAICRQAVFDVMQFNARDPYFVADPNTFPAFGWFDNLDDCARNPCPFQGNSEEQVSILLSSLSVPTAGPTDRGEAFSSQSVAYSPDVVQSPDGGLQSRLGSVSFDPGVQNEEHDGEFAAVTKTASGCGDSWGFCVRFEPHRAEGASVDPGVRKEELHAEELQDVGLQNEELLNEQLHYSHHTCYTASLPEVCRASASDEDSACHGKDWQGDLKDFKDEEEDNVHVESVESSTAVAAEEASLASQSNDAVLHSVPLDYSLHSAPLDYSLHSVPLEYSRVQREGGGPEALPLASSKTRGECEVDQRKDNCASPSRLCSYELQSNRSECQAARGKGQRRRRNRRRARAKAQADLIGSSHPGSLSNAVVSSAVTEDEEKRNHAYYLLQLACNLRIRKYCFRKSGWVKLVHSFTAATLCRLMASGAEEKAVLLEALLRDRARLGPIANLTHLSTDIRDFSHHRLVPQSVTEAMRYVTHFQDEWMRRNVQNYRELAAKAGYPIDRLI